MPDQSTQIFLQESYSQSPSTITLLCQLRLYPECDTSNLTSVTLCALGNSTPILTQQPKCTIPAFNEAVITFPATGRTTRPFGS